MSSPHARWSVVTAFTLAVVGAAFAQETAPPAEDGTAAAEVPADPAKKYRDLKKSKNRAIKTLADRYDALVGVQEWGDLSGKFTTKAKYVEHDPDLKWVKLTTAPGKESTVQLSKLNKASQAKVRQIAALQKKLDELSAAEKTDPAGTPEMGGADRQGRGEMAEGESRAPGRDSDRRGRRGGQAGREEGSQQAESEVTPPSPQPWHLSYDDFRANFSATKDGSGEWIINYGQIDDMQALADRAKFLASQDKSKFKPVDRKRILDEAAAATKRMGEVTWEATVSRRSGGVVEFDLPKLPEPLQIVFMVDDKRGANPEEWSRISKGDRVRFKGTISMGGAHSVQVVVRDPEVVQAATPTAAGSPADSTPAPDNPFDSVE